MYLYVFHVFIYLFIIELNQIILKMNLSLLSPDQQCQSIIQENLYAYKTGINHLILNVTEGCCLIIIIIILYLSVILMIYVHRNK